MSHVWTYLTWSFHQVGGIVITNRPDSKNAQYQQCIKQGDILLNRWASAMQKQWDILKRQRRRQMMIITKISRIGNMKLLSLLLRVQKLSRVINIWGLLAINHPINSSHSVWTPVSIHCRKNILKYLSLWQKIWKRVWFGDWWKEIWCVSKAHFVCNEHF